MITQDWFLIIVVKENQKKQDIEDEAFIKNAKLEALDMFMQYKEHLEYMSTKSPVWKYYYEPIVIPVPRQRMRMCYTKSKYTSEDYKRIRNEEYQKLKTEYHK